MSDWIFWLVAGLVLLILEMLAPGAFLMWIGLAACGTGLLILLVPMGFAWHVVAFTLFAAAFLAVGLRLRRPPRTLNTQTAGLAGRTATALAFDGRNGRVRLGDRDWAARVPPDVPPPSPGSRLRVDGVDGTVLIVRPDA
jgi:membrane protein implicated in regulation of membrane protease activity